MTGRRDDPLGLSQLVAVRPRLTVRRMEAALATLADLAEQDHLLTGADRDQIAAVRRMLHATVDRQLGIVPE